MCTPRLYYIDFWWHTTDLTASTPGRETPALASLVEHTHTHYIPAFAMDFLKSAVASIAKGPAFPYTFGDRVDIDQSIWTLHNGTRRVRLPSNCMNQLRDQR